MFSNKVTNLCSEMETLGLDQPGQHAKSIDSGIYSRIKQLILEHMPAVSRFFGIRAARDWADEFKTANQVTVQDLEKDLNALKPLLKKNDPLHPREIEALAASVESLDRRLYEYFRITNVIRKFNGILKADCDVKKPRALHGDLEQAVSAFIDAQSENFVMNRRQGNTMRSQLNEPSLQDGSAEQWEDFFSRGFAIAAMDSTFRLTDDKVIKQTLQQKPVLRLVNFQMNKALTDRGNYLAKQIENELAQNALNYETVTEFAKFQLFVNNAAPLVDRFRPKESYTQLSNRVDRSYIDTVNPDTLVAKKRLERMADIGDDQTRAHPLTSALEGCRQRAKNVTERLKQFQSSIPDRINRASTKHTQSVEHYMKTQSAILNHYLNLKRTTAEEFHFRTSPARLLALAIDELRRIPNSQEIVQSLEDGRTPVVEYLDIIAKHVTSSNDKPLSPQYMSTEQLQTAIARHVEHKARHEWIQQRRTQKIQVYSALTVAAPTLIELREALRAYKQAETALQKVNTEYVLAQNLLRASYRAAYPAKLHITASPQAVAAFDQIASNAKTYYKEQSAQARKLVNDFLTAHNQCVQAKIELNGLERLGDPLNSLLKAATA